MLTHRQISKLRKAFANNLSLDTRLPQPQISKITKSGQFLQKRLGPLLKTGLYLMRNVLTLLAKSDLIQLGLTVAASAAAAICCYSKENPRFPNNIDNLKQISRRYGRILRC